MTITITITMTKTIITGISFNNNIDFQFHQFHFPQVVDYLSLADETAVSLQFHHNQKVPQPISPMSPFRNVLNTCWLCVIFNITQYHMPFVVK